MRTLVRGCTAGCALAALGLAAMVFVAYAPRLRPSVLAVRVEPANWSSVTFESANLPGGRVVRGCCGAAELPGIEHGEYVVSVRFGDGKVLWMSFFHSNAGERRRVDITVRRAGRTASVRYVATESLTLFRARHNVVNRTTRLQETSSDHPLVLDTI